MFYISQLLDKNKFSGSISKYVDLDDYVIRNGYLFNKYTGELVDKYSIFDIITERNYMILDEMMYMNYYNNLIGKDTQFYKIESSHNILRDTNNINIFYSISNDLNHDIYVHDVKNKTNYVIKENKQTNSISNFIGQDDDFVYFINYSWTYKNNKTEIRTIDKKTLVITTMRDIDLSNFPYPYIKQGVNRGEIEIYGAEGSFSKIIIDIYEKKITYRKDIRLEKGNLYRTFTSFTPLEDSNNIYFVTNSSDGELENLYFYKYDKSTEEVTTLEVDKSMLSPIICNSGAYFYHNLRTFNIKKRNKEYLVFAPTLDDDNTKTYSHTHIGTGIKLYLFEIEDNRLNLIDSYQSRKDNPIPYTNLIYREDTGMFIWGHRKYIDFIIINDDMKFESVYLHYGTFECLGIDSKNDIFIQNADTSIDRINRGSDVVIKCHFEKDVYMFDGTPIKSFMTVAVKNYLGEYLEKDVILTLSGNVTFEDGTKTKEIKTSKTGISTIPIIVKTNTKFDCDIKVKKKEVH